MDRKSILGLLIIGGILLVFAFFNNSNPVPPATDDSIASDSTSISSESDTNTSLAAMDTIKAVEVVSHLIPVTNEAGIQLTNNVGELQFHDTLTDLDTFIAPKPIVTPIEEIVSKPEEIVHLENDLLAIDISSKGGRIVNAFLKQYRTYANYVAEKEVPLQLFDQSSTYGIEFYYNEKKKNSLNYDFEFTQESANSVQVKMINPSGKKIIYMYTLEDGKYDVNFDISFQGFSEKDAKDLNLLADFKLLSTEKHLPSEQRVSTVFFKYAEDSYDYLSIGGDDEEIIEQTTQWVAFKQSYFAAILMNKTGFKASSDSKIEIFNLPEEDTTYIKQYKANLDLGVTNINNTVALEWYFGPNDYDLLATYENGSEDIVDLGWGLFRWINVWAMRPIFGWLMTWGLGAGIAIFLLTLFVKMILSPVNYKMYKSSAMMKVLRPEIEKLAKKFPKKEDAMKKQQETMALYRETGVSPMAGCVPMLIQMPILFAIFRLFPSELSLRQKNFLWAEDLSSYDSILNFSFNIPFYGDHISLFTLLMAGTTLLYTHYNSSNMQQPTMEGMPNMKYIMYIFPFLMIFFFNSYSSGLSYYYFISTLMTIGIMWAIKKFMLDEDKIIAKIEANRANPNKKKGKSKFQQRLEEAQKLQAERQKGKK